jgi:hypothetical protein
MKGVPVELTNVLFCYEQVFFDSSENESDIDPGSFLRPDLPVDPFFDFEPGIHSQVCAVDGYSLWGILLCGLIAFFDHFCHLFYSLYLSRGFWTFD